MATTPKQQFSEAFEREHERTMRVLRAYPDEQSDFKPHEKSNSAREVAWPLVVGQDRLMVKGLTTGFDWANPGAPPPAAPATMSEIARAAEQAHQKAVAALAAADPARLDETLKFFVAPKTLGDVPVIDFLWYVLFDHVHHRGQLSVYLHIVGKVPSIYGPSRDEPWR